MLWSRLFIPTLRESPAEAEIASHQLLLRAGYIRQLAAGIYDYLFLGQRCLRKIQAIVRAEMEAIGGQEVLLPGLHPAELWQESGRWDVMGENLFRLRDRSDRALCLAMTHEESAVALARGDLRSYKQLPQIWYQIQTKFRDEPRPRGGLLRLRQFRMKDSYSFDVDAAGMEQSYQTHLEAYRRILTRCGVPFVALEATSGAMGGGESHEFAVLSEVGEDTAVLCGQCGYAANLEKAVSAAAPPARPDPEGDLAAEPFDTPGQKTIADMAKFTGLPESSQMKSLVLVADGRPVLAMLRGDHQLSESKFAAVTGDPQFRQASRDEIVAWFGAGAGSLGPVGVTNMPILADKALAGRRNMISGGNRDDVHLRNVTPGEDFQAEMHDLREVSGGDACARCGGGLELRKAIEVGHIFRLGTKYSESMGLRVLTADGKETMPWMGSYGLGLERILCAAIELFHDKDGMVLPAAMAPFHVVVTAANMTDEAQRQAGRQIYDACMAQGLDALFDDRDERPGVKFKDADLIGVPWRITVGKKLAAGQVELVNRKSRETEDVGVADAAAEVARRLGLWSQVRG